MYDRPTLLPLATLCKIQLVVFRFKPGVTMLCRKVSLLLLLKRKVNAGRTVSMHSLCKEQWRCHVDKKYPEDQKLYWDSGTSNSILIYVVECHWNTFTSRQIKRNLNTSQTRWYRLGIQRLVFTHQCTAPRSRSFHFWTHNWPLLVYKSNAYPTVLSRHVLTV